MGKWLENTIYNNIYSENGVSIYKIKMLNIDRNYYYYYYYWGLNGRKARSKFQLCYCVLIWFLISLSIYLQNIKDSHAHGHDGADGVASSPSWMSSSHIRLCYATIYGNGVANWSRWVLFEQYLFFRFNNVLVVVIHPSGLGRRRWRRMETSLAFIY